MRGRIDVEHEPGSRADGCSNAERLILPSDEDLEVVMDDHFIDRRDVPPAPCMKEDGVPAETFGDSGDRSFRTMIRSRELAVSRACGQSRSHGDQQLRALGVIGRREGLPRAGASAVAADEPRDALGIVLPSVGTVPDETLPCRSVRDADSVRAKRRQEPGRTYGFYGMFRPAHAKAIRKARAQAKTTRTQAFVVRTVSDVSGLAGPHHQRINTLAATVD
jgi:hypothetical protein